MAKLALILGITLTTMPLLAGHVQASGQCQTACVTVEVADVARVEAGCYATLCAAFAPNVGIYINSEGDSCVDDICLLPDDVCQEGHRSSPPVPTRGELGYPDPPGWYIVCM